METASADTHAQFIDDHVAIALRRNPRSLGETAIRFGSAEARDLLASRAAGRPVDYAPLLAAVRAGETGADAWGLAELARVVAAQRLRESDLADAFALLEAARTTDPGALDTYQQSMHLHLAARFAPDARALRRATADYHRIYTSIRGMVDCNRLLAAGRRRRWRRELARLLDARRVRLEPGDGPALSRLEAEARPAKDTTERVSVILAATGTDPVEGLRSILRQTYRDTAVLVLTDRPLGPDAARLLERLDGARCETVPGAAYGQLVNRGLELAEDEVILVLSPREWSAPRMLEDLVRRQADSATAVASRAARLRADDGLRLGPFGTARMENHSGSLLFRRAVPERVGAFDEVGPAAVDEYAARIRAAFGKGSVVTAKTSVQSLLQDSREFTPHVESREGLADAAAAAYRSAYTRWHADLVAEGGTPRMESGPAGRPFALPPAMRAPAEAPAYDLVFASDWRPFGGPAKSMMEEMAAALRLGLRVGVMNLEAMRMMAPVTRPLCGPVQRLVNDGRVDVVTAEDDVAVDTLIVRYPLVLQFDRDLAVRFRPRRLLIHANQPPSEADGSDLRYLVPDCESNAERWFGAEPSWVPQGPQVRRALVEAPSPPRRLEPFDMPGILDAAEWTLVRDSYRSSLPVIGRHSRDHYTKWPSNPETMRQVYPDDPSYDFRSMGGSSVPREVLGGRLPANWIAYGYDETDVKDFLFQLDFWIYFPHEVRIEAFGRAVLEAMAAGCVVVLPESFRSTFGEGALYCEPEDVRSLVDKYASDLEAFLDRSRRGQRHVREHFSREWYQGLLAERFGLHPAAE